MGNHCDSPTARPGPTNAKGVASRDPHPYRRNRRRNFRSPAGRQIHSISDRCFRRDRGQSAGQHRRGCRSFLLSNAGRSRPTHRRAPTHQQRDAEETSRHNRKENTTTKAGKLRRTGRAQVKGHYADRSRGLVRHISIPNERRHTHYHPRIRRAPLVRMVALSPAQTGGDETGRFQSEMRNGVKPATTTAHTASVHTTTAPLGKSNKAESASPIPYPNAPSR